MEPESKEKAHVSPWDSHGSVLNGPLHPLNWVFLLARLYVS